MTSFLYSEDNYSKYLVANQQNNVDLYLCFCGIEVCSPSHSFGPSIRDQYVIHYILEGKGIYRVNDKIYNLKKNQGFLICPGDLTYYESDKDNPWTYIWVAFNGIKSSEYLKYANLSNKNLIFENPYDDKLKNYVLDMLKINRMYNCNNLKLQGLLYLFLNTISESIDNTLDGTDVLSTLYIEKSIEFINSNFSNNIKVADIANYVGLNRSYLYSLFKKKLSLSPQEFLFEFRMNKASELLKNQTLSIGDVSRSVGYMDPLTFSKVFKKYSGYSPKKYRDKNINKL